MKNVFLAFVVLCGLSTASTFAADCSSGSCSVGGVVRNGVSVAVATPARVVRGVRSTVRSTLVRVRGVSRRLVRPARRFVRVRSVRCGC